MAPVAQRDQSETSLDSNTSFGLHNLMVVLRVLEIMVGVMFFHIPVGIMTRSGGGGWPSGVGPAKVGPLWG